MEPFRQQAAAVGNMKRNALERLEKTENSLEELQLRLKEKQDHSRALLETLAPRAEELKKYVNRLKMKSAVYKRCKAEIAGLKAESGVLHRTATILDSQVCRFIGTNDSFLDKTDRHSEYRTTYMRVLISDQSFLSDGDCIQGDNSGKLYIK